MPTFEDFQATIARVYDQNSNVIGTGFLVAPQYLLTCAHVVIDALGLETVDFPKQGLQIEFPGKTDRLKAKVTLWRPCSSYFETAFANIRSGEDIALLKLEKKINLQPIPIKAVENVHELAFKIWGFPESQGKETNGTIRALKPGCQWYQLQVKQDMPPIVGGFSGSPLWHPDQGIIGMTVAATEYDPETNIGGREASAIAGSELYELWHKQGELIAILEGVAWSVVREAYQFARHHYISTQWNTEEPKTLAEAIADLYAMQKQFGQNHQLTFVVYLLTQEKLSQDVAVSLQIWANNHFPDFEAVKQEISDNIQLTSNQDTDEPRLWIILNQGSTGDCYLIEAAYLIKNLGEYESGAKLNTLLLTTCPEIQKINLNQEIATILTAIIEKIPDDLTDLIVEVFLPSKALDLTPDQWRIKDVENEDKLYPLGIEYPVVLRILGRVPGYGKYRQRGSWQQKWKNRNLTELCQKTLICSTRKNDEIIAALDSSTVSGIRSPYPPSEHQDDPKPDFLVRNQGVPFWLWLRKPLDSCTEPTAFENLLTQATLQTLPQRLKAIRNNALNDPNHFAAHISFLADNPEKIPSLQTTSEENLTHPK